MSAIHRLIAAAGLALAMIVSLPAAVSSPQAASCKGRLCGPPICLDIGACPSTEPPTS